MTLAAASAAVDARQAGGVAVLYLGARQGDRAPIADRLSKLGLAVTRTGELAEALAALGARAFAACVVDLSEDRRAAAWIRAIRTHHPQAAVVGVTDPSRPLSAAEAMTAGASDLLSWPFHEAEVAAMVTNLLDQAVAPDREAAPKPTDDVLVAQSPAMRQVVDLVRAAAGVADGIWLSGESGSGRETVARAIHAASARSSAPFVVMDCGEGSPDDVEARLFDAGPDADPPAGKSRALDRIGPGSALLRAQGGVLLLRRVTALPARAQAKLARLLRDGEAQQLDRRGVVALDVRLFVAGDEPAAETLAAGHLRRELHDRVSHAAIDVPPLRRRREDIPVLAVSLLGGLCEALGAPRQQFSRAALTVLGALPWPGNGRELRSLVDTMVRSVERPVIQIEDVLAHVRLDGAAPRADASGSLRQARANFEREWISSALMKHQGRVEDAARTLGIQRTNLYRKVRQLNVSRSLLARKS